MAIQTHFFYSKVSDSELKTTPYISPAEQAILDAKAAEEERIRLALLADDFRERALMAMMNGVLEIKWEDELKKDVPLPKCMVRITYIFLTNRSVLQRLHLEMRIYIYQPNL